MVVHVSLDLVLVGKTCILSDEDFSYSNLKLILSIRDV